ncbi:Annexin A11 [Branchiostoma belcheri]|nr:Annexin A11 [Branchiostoma belcheri]
MSRVRLPLIFLDRWLGAYVVQTETIDARTCDMYVSYLEYAKSMPDGDGIERVAVYRRLSGNSINIDVIAVAIEFRAEGTLQALIVDVLLRSPRRGAVVFSVLYKGLGEQRRPIRVSPIDNIDNTQASQPGLTQEELNGVKGTDPSYLTSLWGGGLQTFANCAPLTTREGSSDSILEYLRQMHRRPQDPIHYRGNIQPFGGGATRPNQFIAGNIHNHAEEWEPILLHHTDKATRLEALVVKHVLKAAANKCTVYPTLPPDTTSKHTRHHSTFVGTTPCPCSAWQSIEYEWHKDELTPKFQSEL